jgi:membrane-associated HD superfamily phosphohydrolase
VRWAPLIATAVLTYVLFPPPIGVLAPLPSVGQGASRSVIAPFGFQVRKTTEEIAREGESRALTAQPVYRFSATAYDSALAAARAYFADLERAAARGPDAVRAAAARRVNLGPEGADYLVNTERRRQLQEVVTHFLGEALSRGVADAGVMRGEASPRLTLRRGDGEQVVPRDSIRTFADLMDQAEVAGIVIDDPEGQRAVRRLVGAFYHPTIVVDAALTTARREQLRASVDPIRYSVRPGDVIVTAGEPVTEEARVKLAALYDELHSRGTDDFWMRGAIGALLYSMTVLGAFWLLILYYRRETYREARQMASSAACSPRWC